MQTGGTTNPDGEELFDLVDESDHVVGSTERSRVHGDPALIHRVAHVLLFNRKGELFLQKRSRNKDVQPGRWDTSVGGHVDRGETYFDAAVREMAEELGITGLGIRFSHKYLHRNDYESEYVCTFLATWDGKIILNRSEIEEGRYWPITEIQSTRDRELFTPNFLDELDRYLGSATRSSRSSTSRLN